MVIRYSIKTHLIALLAGCAALVPISVSAETTPTLTLSSELQPGALAYGTTEPGSKVWLNDTAVRVTPEGRFVLGFERNAKLHQQIRVLLPDGKELGRAVELAPRDYDIQRVEGVPSRTVTPSQKSLDRIRAEAAKVKQARTADTDDMAFLGPFIWPAKGRISGVYGSQRVYNGEPRSPHYGVDVAAPKGAQVVAPADGRVTLAEQDLFYSGGTLIIDHGYGVSSTFLHLSKVEVAVGQQVRQGDDIGKVGSTGRATGPHLDWRMNWYGVRVDPVSVAPPLKDGHTP
ncbi:M23 family metallopeptidase [Marinobacter sp. 1Y8]